MELFGPKSKNFFILSQKKVFLVFQERGLSEKVDLRIKNFRKELPKCKKKKEPTLKKFLIFQEMKLSILKLKKLLHFKRELVKHFFLFYSIFLYSSSLFFSSSERFL